MNAIAILSLVMIFIIGVITSMKDKHNKIKVILFIFGFPIMCAIWFLAWKVGR